MQSFKTNTGINWRRVTHVVALVCLVGFLGLVRPFYLKPTRELRDEARDTSLQAEKTRHRVDEAIWAQHYRTTQESQSQGDQNGLENRETEIQQPKPSGLLEEAQNPSTIPYIEHLEQAKQKVGQYLSSMDEGGKDIHAFFVAQTIDNTTESVLSEMPEPELSAFKELLEDPAFKEMWEEMLTEPSSFNVAIDMMETDASLISQQ